MMKVYGCRPSYEEWRPQIDFQLEKNKKIDWLRVAEVLDGERPHSDFPKVEIAVKNHNVAGWDFFMDGWKTGLLSKNFVTVIGEDHFLGLKLMPATINDEPFFFLRVENKVNCLDKSKSDIEYFRDEPRGVMEIYHYEFSSNLVPKCAVFCIPEVPDLFVDGEMAIKIQRSSVRGVDIFELP